MLRLARVENSYPCLENTRRGVGFQNMIRGGAGEGARRRCGHGRTRPQLEVQHWGGEQVEEATGEIPPTLLLPLWSLPVPPFDQTHWEARDEGAHRSHPYGSASGDKEQCGERQSGSVLGGGGGCWCITSRKYPAHLHMVLLGCPVQLPDS